ncbi:MAG: S41 family peptidase [Woeseiaceae bacterium]|nr:S41 family peptidase [Woeseiaceae bacterium]
MRHLLVFLASLTVVACGGGDSSLSGGPETGTDACSDTGQKQFVYDAMRAWYLWNDLLPTNLDLSQYATAEELVFAMRAFSPDLGNGPVDRFSGIRDAATEQAFFDEGQYEGYGFTHRFEDPGFTDWRVRNVYVDSPAYRAGMRRGMQIIGLNGRTIAEINAAEGLNAVLDTGTVEFTLSGLPGPVVITEDIVTIDPVRNARIIPGPGGQNIGYFELQTFISTADPQFNQVFNDFLNANVSDVIIDMRYNRGGLVTTAELLGDYLGGQVADGLVFSNTEFNADQAPRNDRTELFENLANSLNLNQFVLIATQEDTASASELIANSLDPHVSVGIVGERTAGKPVGQVAIDFCDKVLRPVSFKITNSLGFGDYFDGLPEDCDAPDDIDFPIGDDADPNVIAALSWLENRSCPAAAAAPGGFQKPVRRVVQPLEFYTGSPEREWAGAL